MSGGSSSTTTLGVLISLLDAAEKSWKDKYDIFVKTQGSDFDSEEDEDVQDLLEAQVSKQAEESLRTVRDVVLHGSQEGKLSSEDLAKLTERASSIESHIATTTSRVSEGFVKDIPVSYGSVYTDEAMGAPLGIGTSLLYRPLHHRQFFFR